MRALILCAGFGTRMGKLTEDRPKCMLPVRGRPILEHQIEWLRKYSVRHITVNLYHHPEVVVNHFKDGRRFGAKLVYSVEEELRGSAGAVWAAWDRSHEPLLVLYGDVMGCFSIRRFVGAFRKARCDMMLAIHRSANPRHSGVVRMVGDRIVAFAEKPKRPQGKMASAGVFVVSQRGANTAPCEGDIATDMIPLLLSCGGDLRGWEIPRDATCHVSAPADLKAARTWLA